MVSDNVAYDYRFKGDNNKVYCTEFVDECYNGIFYDSYKTYGGSKILLPDPLKENNKIKSIIEFKH